MTIPNPGIYLMLIIAASNFFTTFGYGVLSQGTTDWSKPTIFYLKSYAETHASRTTVIIAPQLVGNIVWSVQQFVKPECPILPIDILISTQHGAVPWLNESDWSPDLLILRGQRFGTRLDDSIAAARISFDTMGARVFYVTAISLAPEPSKLQKLGLSKLEDCPLAVRFNPRGKVPVSIPLIQLDTNVTVLIRSDDVSFFRLALPPSAYSIRIDIISCHSNDGVNASGAACVGQFLARVSAGSPSDLKYERFASYQANKPMAESAASLLFSDHLSPLSDATYLSLSLPFKRLPMNLRFSVHVHQSCGTLGVFASMLASNFIKADKSKMPVCELYPMNQQRYSFNGWINLNPTSPSASRGILWISSLAPTVIPFNLMHIVDSRVYLVIDIRAVSDQVTLDFCLSRRLSLKFSTADCELRFDLRGQTPLQRIMPHPPAGVWYLAIANRRSSRAEITLYISTRDCPAQCSKGGRCEVENVHAFPVHVCRCYDGFAGDMCEGRVAVSPDPLTALLLLCLSNLAFLPTVALACRRGLLVEALIYCMAMLASAFYHACDNNYARQLCVLPFDTLGKLDFLGAFLSLWMTLLLLVELTQPLKQLVQMAGSLFLMIGVMINRTSFVIIAVPLGIGFLGLTMSWSCHCYTKRRCYPPRRLLLTSLLPGGILALSGFAMFALLDTRANYYLVHSGWHCCVAFAILFLLLPREGLRFLPRSRNGSSAGGSGNKCVMNCGVDRCFILNSPESGDNNRAQHGGIKGDVEYSALPMAPNGAFSSREGVLQNGYSPTPESAMSFSEQEANE